jgi:hypothetical protein
MIKYWFCANIPPRALVDLYNRAIRKKKDQSEERFLFVCPLNRIGSVRFGPDCCSAVRIGSVWFGSDRIGSDRFGSVRIGSVRIGSGRTGSTRFGPVRFGPDRKFFGFFFMWKTHSTRERRRDGDGEVEGGEDERRVVGSMLWCRDGEGEGQ